MRDEERSKEDLVKELHRLRKQVKERSSESPHSPDKNHTEFLDRLPDGIYRSTLDGKLIAVNQTFIKMLGYENRDAFLQINIPRDLYFSSIEKDLVLAKLQDENCTSLTFRFKKKDGGALWVEDHRHIIYDEKKQSVHVEGIVRDITQRKRVEKAFTLQKAYFQHLFENSSEAIILLDISNKVVACNKAFERLFKYPIEEAKGKNIHEMIVPEDQVSEAISLMNRIKSGERVNFETKRKRKDGNLIHVVMTSYAIESKGEQIGIYEIYRDSGQQKQAEEALKQTEERLRDLFENAPDTYLILDFDGSIIEINQHGLKQLGYDKKFLIGTSFTRIIHPDDIPLTKDVIQSVINGDSYKNIEIRLLHRSGAVLWVSEDFSLLKTVDDQPEAIRVTCRDITSSKRLESELARSQRLETAGRVAGQIAHDFNNLLAPLTAYPPLIKEDLPEKHASLEMIEEMESAAIKIAEINQQLLALGRRGHTRMEPVDLNDLLQKILSSYSLPESIVLETDFNRDLFLINGGAAQLTRAVTNIIINAKEAMPDGGILSIKTGNIYLEEPLPGYLTVEPGDYAKIEISDQGHGIHSDVLAKIFEPFFTTKKMDSMRGSGLGLSVVHGIMEDHNGYLTVATDVGKGTTFTFYFPCSSEKSRELKESTLKSKGGNERILVVDDDPVQRKVTSQLLMRLGYDVHSVESGESAIDFLKKESRDLVILDMVLDGTGSAEMYRKILEIKPSQKAIVMTGYAMSQHVEETMNLGAEGLVSKPIILDDLATTVRQALDKKSDS